MTPLCPMMARTMVPKLTCPLTTCHFPHCPCANPTTEDYHALRLYTDDLKATLEMVMDRYGFAGLTPDEADEVDWMLAEDNER